METTVTRFVDNIAGNLLATCHTLPTSSYQRCLSVLVYFMFMLQSKASYPIATVIKVLCKKKHNVRIQGNVR